MFNALRSDELLLGIAQVLRMAADSGGTLEEYERSQLLSAFSVSRLLAAEQRAAGELVSWTKGELDGALAGDGDVVGRAPGTQATLDAARVQVAAAGDGVAIGEALSALLAELPADDPARTAVRRVLRELADREVAALETAS